MATTLVNFRMDSDLKKRMEYICDKIGMNLSTAFNIFANKFVQENGMPFSVNIDPFYSEENMKFLDESIKELNSGKIVTKSMDELEKMADE
ncbi:MAG: type II toxin-antitoxin system RelB/DinJ family antitoxin [Treponema sp.]|nr:type II toxin-antitoxin system RelB/DinJ family antitoxin [Candidatus Treponema equifaecale]